MWPGAVDSKPLWWHVPTSLPFGLAYVGQSGHDLESGWLESGRLTEQSLTVCLEMKPSLPCHFPVIHTVSAADVSPPQAETVLCLSLYLSDSAAHQPCKCLLNGATTATHIRTLPQSRFSLWERPSWGAGWRAPEPSLDGPG